MKDLFFTGKENIKDHLPEIINALVQKNGIVQGEETELKFRKELKLWIKPDSSKKNLGLMYKYILFVNFLVLIIGVVVKPVFFSKTIIGDKIDIPNCMVMQRDLTTDELVPTLEQVEIHQVNHGVKLVEAQTLEGAVYGLGFIHAKDRLWQLDFYRRLA